MMNVAEKPGWVRIFCDDGCGRHVELRLKKMVTHDFYLCNGKEHGAQCEHTLPPRLPGMVKSHELNAAAHCSGITYSWPTPSQVENIARAQNILAVGITQMAIEKASR